VQKGQINALFISLIVRAALAGSTSVGRDQKLPYHALPAWNSGVPGGHAFAIMNAFRNKRPEEVAEQLISDLRTSGCVRILRDFHADDSRTLLSG
jgi:hypothetical protein